ncbi:hypothetical protein QBC46DRAFT_355551 [Diplogelasinospora grovesii]|uniref:Uncharacterized protein n=1 Tax=Diplogelasinospora grovesii TaxID=303347 RepID=A0AAN6N7I7_9PEZI|nr:hypothetical protein QBC46DRAFT_355551 [Diplogelasinospora grovesii]
MSNYTAPTSPPAAVASQGSSLAAAVPPGPPYIPQTAQLGGVPTIPVDVPICSVLLALFAFGAATNMTIFQLNRKHNYKFLFSGLLFGFCMARIVALSMRIVWSTRPHDLNVAIAAQIFTAAGVLLLFVTNLVFAQRMVRAYHPRFGWHALTSTLFGAIFVSVVVVLVMVITVTIQSFFTANPNTRRIDRDVQLSCATYLAFIAFLPVPIALLAATFPAAFETTKMVQQQQQQQQRRLSLTPVDRFGQGGFRTKLALLAFTALLLTAGAVFRAAVAFQTRPIDNPAWYQSKPAYYLFNFGVEIVVVYTYVLSRFDRRFHVPDGSSAPGHYSSGAPPTPTEMSEDTVAVRPPTAKRQSVNSFGKRSSTWSRNKSRSRERGTGETGETGSERRDSVMRDADLEWMAKAMRELYGEDE